MKTAEFYISKIQDYNNWKTRKVLGIKTGTVPVWYFSIHMGWWDDGDDPFSNQWERFSMQLGQVVPLEDKCYIMGDFNSPSQIPSEGYDYVSSYGWKDTWQMAEKRDSGITVGKVIDGWKERLGSEDVVNGMRIDYIWCNREVAVSNSKVICNGSNYPIVSDHYGVLIEVDEE